VSKEGSYSFHYRRAGRSKRPNRQSTITKSVDAHRAVALGRRPLDADKSPRQLAEDMIEMLHPGTRPARIRLESSRVGRHRCPVSGQSTPRAARNSTQHVVVVKEEASAFWFSLLSSAGGYDSARALKAPRRPGRLVRQGAASKGAVKRARRPGRATRALGHPRRPATSGQDAKRFSSCWEFALGGTPLTASQREGHPGELLEGWRNESRPS